MRAFHIICMKFTGKLVLFLETSVKGFKMSLLCQTTFYPRCPVKVLPKPNKRLLFYFVFPLSCQTEMILCPENERCLVDKLVIVHSITP